MSTLSPDKPPLHDLLLSVPQAADRLRLRVQTLRNWIAARRIGVIRVGRRVSVPESEVLRILTEGWAPPAKVWETQR